MTKIKTWKHAIAPGVGLGLVVVMVLHAFNVVTNEYTMRLAGEEVPSWFIPLGANELTIFKASGTMFALVGAAFILLALIFTRSVRDIANSWVNIVLPVTDRKAASRVLRATFAGYPVDEIKLEALLKEIISETVDAGIYFVRLNLWTMKYELPRLLEKIEVSAETVPEVSRLPIAETPLAEQEEQEDVPVAA